MRLLDFGLSVLLQLDSGPLEVVALGTAHQKFSKVLAMPDLCAGVLLHPLLPCLRLVVGSVLVSGVARPVLNLLDVGEVEERKPRVVRHLLPKVSSNAADLAVVALLQPPRSAEVRAEEHEGVARAGDVAVLAFAAVRGTRRKERR